MKIIKLPNTDFAIQWFTQTATKAAQGLGNFLKVNFKVIEGGSTIAVETEGPQNAFDIGYGLGSFVGWVRGQEEFDDSFMILTENVPILKKAIKNWSEWAEENLTEPDHKLHLEQGDGGFSFEPVDEHPEMTMVTVFPQMGRTLFAIYTDYGMMLEREAAIRRRDN